VFQGEEEEKERKKGEIVENQAHFVCSPKSICCCLHNIYLHQYAQACTAILTINSRAISDCCSALLLIVYTPTTSTYLSTSLARHCTVADNQSPLILWPWVFLFRTGTSSEMLENIYLVCIEEIGTSQSS
jgi:hypothetical protein